MNLFVLIAMSLITSREVASDHCDLVEVNHFHDSRGDENFTQIILWHWYLPEAGYHVRAWRMAKNDGDRPRFCYSSGLTHVEWNEGAFVVARHIKESWTQYDPERADKRELKEDDRIALIKRGASRPPILLPPMEVHDE